MKSSWLKAGAGIILISPLSWPTHAQVSCGASVSPNAGLSSGTGASAPNATGVAESCLPVSGGGGGGGGGGNITNLQHNIGPDGSATSSTTVAVTGSVVTSGSLVVGAVTWSNTSNDINKIQDDKLNSYTVIDTAENGGQSFATFYAANITNGPSTITVTFSGGHTFRRLEWDEFSNIATSSPLDGHFAQTVSGSTSPNAMTSGNFTTTVNGDLVWGALTNPSSAASSMAAGTGPLSFAILNNSWGAVNDGMSSEWVVQSNASATTAATFTEGSVQSMMVGGASFKP